MNKKTIVLCLLLLIPTASFAGEPYARISIGYNTALSIGAGYQFSDHFALGAEAIGWSDLCGLVGGVDARYYFSDWKVKPFLGAFVGYGYLGQTMNYEKYYDLAYRAMAGFRWKRIELGVGVTYDSFYQLWPAATISFTLPLVKRK